MAKSKKSETVSAENNEDIFEQIVENTYEEFIKISYDFDTIKLKNVKVCQDTVMKWTDKQRVDFILYLIKTWDTETNFVIKKVRYAYVEYLLKTQLSLDENDAEKIYEALATPNQSKGLASWDIDHFIACIESQYGENTLSPLMLQTLNKLRKSLEDAEFYDKKKKLKLINRIDILLHSGSENAVRKVLLMSKDDLKKFVDKKIDSLPDNEKPFWYQLFEIANTATGAKPKEKFLTQSKEIIDQLDEEKFRKTVSECFLFIVKFKEIEKKQNGNETYYEFLDAANIESMKGLVWMCSNFMNASLAYSLANLAERAYRTIPDKGPAAAALGNACFYALAASKNLESVGQLSRLKLRIKHAGAQSMIEKYLWETAKEQKVSLEDIEDFAADDFGLIDGKKRVPFDDYEAELTITGIGKAEIQWIKPNGRTQPRPPDFVAKKYADRWNELKECAKNVRNMLSTHRDRIDRMFRADRKMTYEHFEKYYLNHGLISYLASKLIWNFTNENGTQSAVYPRKGLWVCKEGVAVEISKKTTVSLWHPATESVENVQMWRAVLTKIQLQQPLKQAYREIYLLTDAEKKTKSYSNRMASHLLKQNQLSALAKTRGWKYSSLTNYDEERGNGTAELPLPECDLKAQFWVNGVNAGESWSDTLSYVCTDQVRFSKIGDDKAAVDLIDVPVVPFSEVMRDVDLFVGVASVGNDPQWVDSGGELPAYRDYWQSYSFGELSETAKTRKEILEQIIPRLKISKVAEIKDKFLVIRGKLRTYKIHIGSTNILMEPNDQYLCIVPDRREKDYTQNIFLPFEGDNGLSLILSKAFLLADDDKIADETITSQIGKG